MVGETVRKIYDREYEVIVVDDGSPDNTYRYTLIAMKDPFVRVYRLPRNIGKGFALLYGYVRSRGSLVIFFDGDLDVDPRQILLLVRPLERGMGDVSITSKWCPGSRVSATLLRKFLSRSFNMLDQVIVRA